MQKPKIYISIPYSIPDVYYLRIINEIKNKYSTFAEITYYDRHGKKRYTDDLIGDADYLIVAHPNNKFKYDTQSLPVGVKSELERFIKLGRDLDVYGIYSPITNDAINVYHINFNDITYNNVELITGTTSGLYNELVTLWGDGEKPIVQQLPTGYGKSTKIDPNTFEEVIVQNALPLLIKR